MRWARRDGIRTESCDYRGWDPALLGPIRDGLLSLSRDGRSRAYLFRVRDDHELLDSLALYDGSLCSSDPPSQKLADPAVRLVMGIESLTHDLSCVS
jgi:hypothetical protein